MTSPTPDQIVTWPTPTPATVTVDTPARTTLTYTGPPGRPGIATLPDVFDLGGPTDTSGA